MKRALLWIGIAAAVVTWIAQNKNKQDASAKPSPIKDHQNRAMETPTVSVEPRARTIAPTLVGAQPEPAAPSPSSDHRAQHAHQSKPHSKPEPVTTDRFALRKLNHPIPTSVTDLLSKLTPYHEPKLPALNPNDNGDRDGDVLTLFRGYVESAKGRLHQLEMARTSGGVVLSIPNSNGSTKLWDSYKGELQLRNFDQDPYSLVLLLPDRRIAYLKFYSNIQVTGFDYPVRGMIGWLLSDRTETAKIYRVALIDSHLQDLEVPSRPGEYNWPNEAAVSSLLPKPLAHVRGQE